MAVQVRFTDHSGEVLAKMKGNVEKAISALGTEAVAQIKEQMEHASLRRALYILAPPLMPHSFGH